MKERTKFFFYLIVKWTVWTTEVMEFEQTVRLRSKLRHLHLVADIQGHEGFSSDGNDINPRHLIYTDLKRSKFSPQKPLCVS